MAIVVLGASSLLSCERGPTAAAGRTGADEPAVEAPEIEPSREPPAPTLAPEPAQPVPRDPRALPVEIPTRVEWHEVDALPHSHAAIAVERALRADGTPYDPSFAVVGTSPATTRRGFVLERSEWLLGEPLVVEFRVEVEGPGIWKELVGGNYRAHGRDENFMFVLLRADGTVVPDIYAHTSGAHMVGGIAGIHEVTADAPLSYWLPVQRYSAITEPGTYELYCLGYSHGFAVEIAGWHEAMADAIPQPYAATHTLVEDRNQLVDRSTGQPVELFLSPSASRQPAPGSPLAAQLPSAIASMGGLATDVAHFRVEIRAPKQAEREAMVASWTAIVEDYDASLPAPRHDAARDAMWFARQDDFMPLIATWLQAGEDGGAKQDGLAMRGTDEAIALLLAHGDGSGIGALSLLEDDQAVRTIPRLIERLSDPAADVRAASFSLLTEWTDERFGAGWVGYDSGRPTADEAAAIQARASEWWTAHWAGFAIRRRP